MEPEYIVKNALSIVYGPCGYDEARSFARNRNECYQTDEYRVEEYDSARIKF